MTPPRAEIQALDHVDLFDTKENVLRADWAISWRGQAIDWVGPSSALPQEIAAHAVDGSNMTLVPGLIDCHVHLTADSSTDFAGSLASDRESLATLKALNAVQACLHAGVTTVRDCGAANDVAIQISHAVDDGLVSGARVIAAGRVITMTGGHCHYIGRESDGVDGVRRAVRQELKAGADFIKVMATGGVLTPNVTADQVTLDEEELLTVVREAHNAGRRVACHAVGSQGIRNALRAGVDSIEHGFHLEPDLIQMALDQGVFLVPTLRVLELESRLGPEAGLPAWLTDKADRECDYAQANFQTAIAAGIRFAAGTDSGCPFTQHGDLVEELLVMHRLGLSAADCILAATKNAAENLDVWNRVGSLDQGKDADMLLVNGDPLQDLGHLKEVRLVVQRGQVVRNSLDQAQS